MKKVPVCIPVLLMLAALGACSTSPVTRFYLLTPAVEGINRRTEANGMLSLAIAPISFPAYLDRPHIILRSNDSEIYPSDIHRWGEPLRDNFTRVLAANLSMQLGTDGISIEPSRIGTGPAYRLTVEVRQFDANRQGTINLVAYWTLRDADGAPLVTMRKSEVVLSGVSAGNYAAIVEAMSEAVGRLSRDIAEQIKAM